MRTDRLAAVLLTVLVLAGCASDPAARESAASAAIAAETPGCGPDAGKAQGYCTLPPDVRAFLEDRAACDHFRGEPWPESDSDEDRRRRRELVEGVRVNCAGTDRRLAALRERYVADPAVISRLSAFEVRIED